MDEIVREMRPGAAGLPIVRVLHGARDIAGIVVEEFGGDDGGGGDGREWAGSRRAARPSPR